MAIRQALPLSSGGSIPTLGFGVFQIAPGEATQRAVSWALEAGYRHIDTARFYANEQDVGHAIRQSGIPREEVFVTTKLRNEDQGYRAALRAGEASALRLGLGYVDLYLIHFPVTGLRQESWDALIELQQRGLCRAIGVSNYTVRHLEELLSESDVRPAVNQVECHPFLSQEGLRELCARENVVMEAYCPLTRGERLKHPVVKRVAEEVGRTPAQVLIRWGLQHGLVVLPKSEHRERIQENAKVFDFSLSPSQMEQLDGLNEDLHTSWDPTNVP